MRPLLLAACVALVLAGCTLGPNYTRPSLTPPGQWREAAADTASLANMPWWEFFQDPALRTLVATALEENKDLRIAATRVLESRAQLGIARADQFPGLDANGSYQRQRISERGAFPLPPGTRVENDVFRTTLDLSFELDIWGRLRRASEAARAELLASEENRRAVVFTLVSDVAQAYFDLLDLDRELAIARQTVDSRRESLRIVRLRFDAGLTSELDLRRAEGELEAALAAVPDLERQATQTENRLSILLGRNPGAIARGPALTEQPLPPAIPAGLPSALLDRRPDLRRAEQQLVAASARIGEAKAAFFPQISLTGAFGVESVALSDLFTGPARLWQFGPRITLPIFNAGRNRARLDAATARRDSAVLEYQQAVQQAFREVEDALVGHRKARERAAAQAARVDAAERTLALAELRYVNGLANYLEVLDAQRELFTAQIELTRTRRDQLTTAVQVYKALGGGWDAGGPAAAAR